MRTTTLSGLAGFATALGLLFGAAPGAAAAAADPTIELPDSGDLLADGAGASVTVTFQCEAGQSYNMFVELSQAVGEGRTASGAGFAGPGTCTGNAQTEELLVLAGGGFFAFRDGDAVARTSLSVCPSEQQMCSQAMDSGVLELREALED
ncbi:hypothetical protein HER39_09940 [Arthrobacter deserti]|uniref:Uncharacterized protein n=1 Tax=Arthrobacter deserti TaxID=1742687 RepID=A0ABX1JP69_9MICC|nr:hypothetical protein [Arthrobacter deserti]